MHIFDTKFTRHCPKSRKFTAPDQKTTHHLQQLGDLLRVACGVESDATAEAVDGRAKAMQLSVVDSKKRSWMWDGCVEIVLGFDTKDG